MDKFFSTTFKLSLIPRWGDYATKYKDNTASHSYRVACLSLIISKLENHKGRNIDIEKVLFKALFHDFNEFETGPIRHETKKEPRLKNLITKLERKKAIDILNMLPEALQEEFEDYIVDAEDNTEEGRIVDIADSLDAMIFASRENSTLNKDNYFELSYYRIKERLLRNKSEVVEYIIDEGIENPKSNLYALITSILNMDRINRWSGKFNNLEDNDATHSFRVAVILALLSKYEEYKTGVKNDNVNIIGKALMHDLPESVSGDINGPVKHSTAELKEAFEVFERELSEEMSEWFPEEIKTEMKDMLVNAKDDSKEGVYVDIGDKIDALLKSLHEMSHHSLDYKQSYRNQLINIREKYGDYFIVNYFLSKPLHDLYLDLI